MNRSIFTSNTARPLALVMRRDLDALVLTSRTLPNWKEQFGRVLVEAMACGVPVVGSRSGEIAHVIGDAGLIVPEEDVDALRSALLQLMQDDALRTELGRRGRRRVLERFTQAQIAAETVEVYRSMIAGRGEDSVRLPVPAALPSVRLGFGLGGRR